MLIIDGHPGIMRGGKYTWRRIMSDYHKMSIEDLQESLSKAQDIAGTIKHEDTTPIQAILHAKITMYLSHEIAYLKEALCEQAKKVLISNERLSKTNERLAVVNLLLTAIIALSALAGVVITILKK